MMKPKVIRLLIVLSVIAAPVSGKTDFFPEDNFSAGWKGEKAEIYRSAEELFDYMNGGAELYLEYRYANLEVKEYTNEDNDYLTVEVYLYAKPSDAFGIFSVDTTGLKVDIGSQGRKSAVMTRFWKGNYYVKAYLWQRKAETEEIPEITAQALASELPDNDEIPLYLEKLLKSDLKIAFIRGPIALRQVVGSFYPGEISFDRSEGAVWVFPTSEENSGALVLSYSSAEKAVRKFENIWQSQKGNAGEPTLTDNMGTLKNEDGTITAISLFIEDNLNTIIWIPREKNLTACNEVFDKITASLEEKKSKQ